MDDHRIGVQIDLVDRDRIDRQPLLQEGGGRGEHGVGVGLRSSRSLRSATSRARRSRASVLIGPPPAR